jgi:hypothetical protein
MLSRRASVPAIQAIEHLVGLKAQVLEPRTSAYGADWQTSIQPNCPRWYRTGRLSTVEQILAFTLTTADRHGVVVAAVT